MPTTLKGFRIFHHGLAKMDCGSHDDCEEGGPSPHGEALCVSGQQILHQQTNRHYPQHTALQQGRGLCHTHDVADSQSPMKGISLKLQEKEKKER